MSIPRLAASLFLLLLSACASFQRSDDAAAAKRQMIGMTREDVLACMGPTRKKASEGTLEVWSYLSTNGQGDSTSGTYKPTGYSLTTSSHTHDFCTVNVVMKDGLVKAVNYTGPTSGSLFAPDEQCGYAVANCVAHGSD